MTTKIKTYLILAVIIILGIFLRVYHIDSAPPGVYPDEAVNGLDAIDAMHGQWQWFYPANNGREGLFMNLIALCFKFFGISVLTLKLPTIIFGTLAIWGIYLLGAELFRNRAVGLFGAFLTAVSFWSINFSRISFRANMTPALLAFSFYFLFRGMRTRKWYDFALGGLVFGLGLHTYIAFRIAPLILIVMLFALIISRENFLKNYWRAIVTFIFFAFISASPMLYTFFVAHPEYWQSRTSEISILNPAVNQGHLLSAFGKTFGLALAKYNFWGDQNWRQNYPPYAILDPLTGIAFLFGFIYAIIKIFHLLYVRFRRKIRDEKLEVYVFLVAGFLIMLLPEIMGEEGNPHALRSIGTMPFVFVFAALTFNYFWGQAQSKTYIHKKIVTGIILVMLFSIGLFNPLKYFVFWANNPKTAEAFEANLADAQKYIATLPAGEEIFFVSGNMQRVPLRLFNSKNPNFQELHPTDLDTIRPKDPKNFTVIFTDYQKDEIVSNLTSRFPDLQLEERTDKAGMKFYILK
ncbi:MAG: glycosyltransferase family 39 protein [Parcubacteria group bacterium]